MNPHPAGVLSTAAVLIMFLGGCALNAGKVPVPAPEQASPELLPPFEELPPALYGTGRCRASG